MKTRRDNGSARIGVLLFILLCASIALNVVLLKGGERLGLGGKIERPESPQPPPLPSSESSYLRELAEKLNLKVSSEKTPGDIAYDINQCLANRLTYRGDVLTPKSFENVTSSIVVPKDEATVKAYHEFVSRIAGKTIIVLE